MHCTILARAWAPSIPLDPSLSLQGATTIAVRYCALRQQFGPPDSAEVAVLDYTSTQVCLCACVCVGLAWSVCGCVFVRVWHAHAKT
jgi:hypothetical protein